MMFGNKHPASAVEEEKMTMIRVEEVLSYSLWHHGRPCVSQRMVDVSGGAATMQKELTWFEIFRASEQGKTLRQKLNAKVQKAPTLRSFCRQQRPTTLANHFLGQVPHFRAFGSEVWAPPA